MQTKYVAAIENKNTPDVGQLETGAPARFAGMGQLLDLTTFAAPDRGRGRQAAGQRGARSPHRRQDVLDPLVHHAGLLVRVARRVREEQGEAAEHVRGGQGGGRRAHPPQGQLLRHGPELEPHRRRLRRHAEPDVLLRRGLGHQGRQVPVDQERQDAAGHEVGDRHLQGQPAAARHAHLDRLRQQRELHRQEHRADLQRPQHHLRPGERGGQGHRRQGEEAARGGAGQSRGPAAPGRAGRPADAGHRA